MKLTNSSRLAEAIVAKIRVSWGDESNPTIKKRFDPIVLDLTEKTAEDTGKYFSLRMVSSATLAVSFFLMKHCGRAHAMVRPLPNCYRNGGSYRASRWKRRKSAGVVSR